VPYLVYIVRVVMRFLSNVLRRLGRCPDVVSFTLERVYPELCPPRPPFPQRLIQQRMKSLLDLEASVRRAARDPRVRTLLFHLRSMGAPAAQLQSLRDLLSDARSRGKRVVVWAASYNLATYYVATAADEIYLQPGGVVSPLGSAIHTAFLGEALEKVGLKADFVAISPYKTAADRLTRSSMSDESREMTEWLVGDLYDQMVSDIATGRRMEADEVRRLIDAGFHLGVAAQEAGLVDAVIGEEELPKHLGVNHRPARISPFSSARQRLLAPPVPRPGKVVAILRIGGMIVDGRSQRPPMRPALPIPLLFEERAGDLTIVAQARRIASSRRVGALVVHVDSPGGSATASEAMSAALRTVAAKKTVVVSMGNVAASGGYYVSTPGTHIMAQPGTVTGSIGVLAGKISRAGLLEKLSIHQETIERGAHASLFSPARPLTEDEQAILRGMIEHTYDLFLERVSDSRGTSREAVDKVGGGRVWTGRQAVEHGLVDSLGGLRRAIAVARQRAGLHEACGVHIVGEPKRPVPPSSGKPHPIDYGLGTIREIANGSSVCLLLFDPPVIG